MPDDPHRDATRAPRRARRFPVRDADDHGATARTEVFLSGPRARGRTGVRAAEAPGRVDANFDTRTDFAAALDREAARTERYGRPATVLAVEFEIAEPKPGAAAKQSPPTVETGEMVNVAQVARQVDRLAGPIGVTLRREARDTDRIARVAPNRFHVLLPETNQAAASQFIDRARRACEVWFAGAAINVRLRIEAASSGDDVSLPDALAAVDERISSGQWRTTSRFARRELRLGPRRARTWLEGEPAEPRSRR